MLILKIRKLFIHIVVHIFASYKVHAKILLLANFLILNFKVVCSSQAAFPLT